MVQWNCGGRPPSEVVRSPLINPSSSPVVLLNRRQKPNPRSPEKKSTNPSAVMLAYAEAATVVGLYSARERTTLRSWAD
ncbi:hypothetical protein M8C21_005726 [Ambrosia artemisiifolia]|uniref:Uncharacterized protein n=1 Tax=Ambrosia artemisiifolia TaxID=4212 RepID=A0AAD5CRZ9_AMBAR|nr:hypothetical protein M8C21_005726 [Ambrosia artemisiifolia]